MPCARHASTRRGSALAAKAGLTAAARPTTNGFSPGVQPSPRSTTGCTTFQPCRARSVARPWRRTAVSSRSARRSRNHGARWCASLTRFRSTSLRSCASLMSAPAPRSAASSAVNDAVCRSFMRRCPPAHGRRSASRRPPCGATRTSGPSPGRTVKRALVGTSASSFSRARGLHARDARPPRPRVPARLRAARGGGRAAARARLPRDRGRSRRARRGRGAHAAALRRGRARARAQLRLPGRARGHAGAHEPEPRDAGDGRLPRDARDHGERLLEPRARRAAGDARGRGADRGGDALHGGRDDAAVARLLDDLHSRGRWGRSVVIVTADHGMSAVDPTPERPQPAISLGPVLREAGVGGVAVVADGGVEHVYAERVAACATTVGDAEETLARVAALARATPGVAETLARLPVPGVPALDAVHPGWHLDHPRTGELLLVAASGHLFVDPFNP